MEIDYLIVGSGLTGAVIARELRQAGFSVLVLERREHVGGNVHDHEHSSGIRVHTYGPHYFRTSSEKLWNYVTQFDRFYKYEAALQTLVDGRLEAWPVHSEYIKHLVGNAWAPGFQGTPKDFEEASLAMMPALVYEKFVKGYTAKQWGVDPKTLDAGLARRFEVREDGELRLHRHRFQGIPERGYAHFTRAILERVPVITNVDYLSQRTAFAPKHLTIFTGPIDEYFNYRLGKLAYRGQRREHEFHPELEFSQPCGQVNNPGLTNGGHIRTLEWKHMMQKDSQRGIKGTLLTREYPCTPTKPGEYEYPFPDQGNKKLFEEYRALSLTQSKLMVCGRLGEYRYYDMDQAIGRAMVLAKRILVMRSASGLESAISANERSARLLHETSKEEQREIQGDGLT
jgi:UDP-galactopyranose mutase